MEDVETVQDQTFLAEAKNMFDCDYVVVKQFDAKDSRKITVKTVTQLFCRDYQQAKCLADKINSVDMEIDE